MTGTQHVASTALGQGWSHASKTKNLTAYRGQAWFCAPPRLLRAVLSHAHSGGRGRLCCYSPSSCSPTSRGCQIRRTGLVRRLLPTRAYLLAVLPFGDHRK